MLRCYHLPGERLVDQEQRTDDPPEVRTAWVHEHKSSSSRTLRLALYKARELGWTELDVSGSVVFLLFIFRGWVSL